MQHPLSVVVADDEPDILEYMVETLFFLGHRVVASASNGHELVAVCQEREPDLIITDIDMPLMDGIRAAHEICRSRPVPVILLSAYFDSRFIEGELRDHVLGYLMKPVKDADLEPAITLAQTRFEELHRLRRERELLVAALEDDTLRTRLAGALVNGSGSALPSELLGPGFETDSSGALDPR